MLEKKEDIDNLFSDYLKGYEEKAPDYVWKNIQAELKVAKLRKRDTIIRAMAATVALFITFGLGYYYSDISQKPDFSSNDLYINPELILNRDQDKQPDNINNVLTDNYKHKINLRSENQGLENQKENSTDGLIFKLFYRTKSDFLKIIDRQNESNKNTRNNKNYANGTTNQLLIDTLFKKENLSERGFLLIDKKGSKSKWSVGTKFSPIYSLAENNKQSTVNNNMGILKSAKNNNIPDIKADEKSLMSYSGGFNVNYNFTKRWSIESGLFYSERRQMADNLIGSSIEGLQNEMQVHTPEGVRYIQPAMVSDVSSPQIIGTTQDETYYSLNMDYVSHFEYIELPLIVRYKIIDRRLGLDVLSGISTNFLVGNRSTLMYNNSNLWTGTSEGISPMLYDATVGLGLNYYIFQNLSLNIEPTFKYSIIPTESTTLLRYPYSFAIYAGFSFRF